MRPSHPTRRETDLEYSPPTDSPPVGLTNIPWIDIHNHGHTLSWEDRERFSIAGCEAMIMIAGGYHWTPYRPIEPDDLRYLWDDAVSRRPLFEDQHFYDVKLGIGIHTGVRIEGVDELLDVMPAYCRRDEVVAIGETGITPSQHACAWELPEQQAVVQAQYELAAELDLPVILHTPSQSGTDTRPIQRGGGIPGYEKDTRLGQSPVVTGDNPALDAVKLDFDLVAESRLPENSVVASHTDPNNVTYLLEDTDCYVSFTIGHSWLTGVTTADVAAAIDEYGPDRIMMDTDCANVLRTDEFAIKRGIFDLYRYGIDVETIKQIVYDNPRDVFNFAE